MSEWREFRRESHSKKDKTLFWRIRQDKDSYTTEHWQGDGGAVQSFKDIPGDKGKPDTKAYMGAVDNATFSINREIRKKEEHGYVEYVDGNPLTTIATSIDFSKPLPKNFCPLKPQSSISDSAHEKIHKSGKARYSRKFDGFGTIFVFSDFGGWQAYSRRMDIITEWFPNHIAELEASDFPKGTILVGEMVCIRDDGTDNYKATSRVCRSDADVARKLIEDKECPEPNYFIFDMLFYDGKPLNKMTYDNRSKIWRKFSKKLIKPVTYHNVDINTWEKLALEQKWEGFVITDGDCIPDDKFFSFDGEAKRPKGHFKLKTVRTTDAVVYAVSMGNGKRLDAVGSIFVKQLDSETGLFFNCGKVGSGFTEETTEEMTNLCKEKGIPFLKKDPEALKIDLQDTSHDIVVEIKFNERQEDTNKFKFPVFVRIHNDKLPSECIAEV